MPLFKQSESDSHLETGRGLQLPFFNRWESEQLHTAPTNGMTVHSSYGLQVFVLQSDWTKKKKKK